jgi:hypothetical protein
MSNKIKIKWKSKPADNNFPAAESYLALLYSPDEVKQMIRKLKSAKIVEFKSKDIFRASGLPLLGISNLQFRKNMNKIAAKKKLSPILLVRDPKTSKTIVADGYHRLCAVYFLDENIPIPCSIV